MDLRQTVLELNQEFKKEHFDKKTVVQHINKIVQAYNQLSQLSKSQVQPDVEALQKSIEQGEKKFRKKVIDLQTVMEIAKDLSGSLEISNLIKTIILTSMGHLLVETGVVFVLDKKKSRFQIREVKGIKEDLSGIYLSADDPFIAWLKETGKPIQKTDLTGKGIPGTTLELLKRMNCEIAIPFMVKNRLNGILVLGQRMGGVPFTDFNIEFLVTLGGFASIAIENAGLYQDLDNKVKDLSLLYNISSEINKSEDQDVVIELLMDTLTAGFGVKKCSLILYDELKNIYHIERNVNLTDEQAETYLQILLEQQNPLSTGERFYLSQHDKLAQNDLILSIPLTAGGKKVGLLNLYAFNDDFSYTEDFGALLSILASQIAPPLVLSQYLSKRNDYREQPYDFIYHAVEDFVSRSQVSGSDFSIARLVLNQENLDYATVKDIGGKIRTLLQESDMMIHSNFNEFLILMPSISKEEVQALFNDFIPTVSDVGVSHRIVSYPADGETSNALLGKLLFVK
jgi:GAF domain-containing protein